MAEFKGLASLTTEQQTQIIAGLQPLFTEHVELLSWLDSEIIASPSVTVNRLVEISGGGPVDCTTEIESIASESEGEEFKLKQFGRAFKVCGNVNGASAGNGQFINEYAEQMAAAVQDLGDIVAYQIVRGNGVGTAIKGLDTINQTSFAISGANTSLTDLDKLIDSVKYKSGKMAFVANLETRRALKALLNEEGDKTRVELRDNVFVPGYEGIPMIAHSAVQNGHVYLVNGDKLRGSYMIYGDRMGSGSPFRVVDVGWDATKDLWQARVFVNAAVVTKNLQSLARLTGVN